LVLIHYLGLNGLALATSLSAVITFFVRIKAAGRYLSLDYRKIMNTAMKVLLAAIISCVIPRLVFFLYPVNDYFLLIASVVMGVIGYLALMKLMKVDEIGELASMLKKRIKRAKKF